LEVLDQIRHVIKHTDIATFMSKVPKQFGTAKAGTLKAAAWKSVFAVHLPIALITLWGGLQTSRTSALSHSSEVLDNSMHLVQAIGLAYRRATSPDISRSYKEHVAQYLPSINSLYPHTHSRPNHHLMFHLGDFLLLFGPVYGWHCFPFERLIGFVQRISTSHILGTFSTPLDLLHLILDHIMYLRANGENSPYKLYSVQFITSVDHGTRLSYCPRQYPSCL
jgi:hypothetical protein